MAANAYDRPSSPTPVLENNSKTVTDINIYS